MNHSYNVFLDKNLIELARIYQEANVVLDTILIIQIDENGKIQVFTKVLTELPKPIQADFINIRRRDSSLLDKDRYVTTCATKTVLKEMYILILDPKKHFVLRGYQETYAYEFETFLSKSVSTTQSKEHDPVNFKGQWMIQSTPVGSKYLELCRSAVNDVEVFKEFRGKMDYQNIIIGGDKDRNQAYYQLLQSSITENLKICDSVGNPIINPETGFSTYTLRCLYTVRDLEKYFGPLVNKNIVEIGSGHGGLVQMMALVSGFKSYTLVDLPVVNQLARKYLGEFEGLPHDKIKYMSSEEIMPRKYDLVISEYALSELDTRGQNYYMENVIKYSQEMYLAMNIWNQDNKKEMYKRLSKCVKRELEEYPEEPVSKYPNYKWICKKTVA